MRFLKLSLLNELRHYCHSLPKLNPKKRHLFPWPCSSSSCNLVQIRSHCTSWPKWKDVTQPKDQETEKLDLDMWKSVMRSQAAQVETLSANDNDAEDQEDVGQDSSLEATRELVDMWRLAGKQVPEEITDEELSTVAELSTKSGKKKYLKYLAIREGFKKARKRKQEERRMASAERQNVREDTGEEEEGSSKLKNTFLVPFWQRSLDKLIGWRCAQSMLFGQPLVFDMSYESHMTRREMENTIAQLIETEGWNRRSEDPFHLHFCNLDPDGAYHKELLKRYGTETWERLLITASPRRYVDVFPRQQLVYLTSDSPNVLRTFDHDKVYIVGALVDRSSQPGLSLANAKRLKLATARLPLDEHLDWGAGAKNLSLDQMIRILLTVKQTGNWEEALAFVPQRKHAGFHSARRAGGGDSDVAGGRAAPLADRDFKKQFISKTRSKPPGSGSTLTQSPVTAVLKRKLAAQPGAQKVKRNWWEG